MKSTQLESDSVLMNKAWWGVRIEIARPEIIGIPNPKEGNREILIIEVFNNSKFLFSFSNPSPKKSNPIFLS